MKQISLFNNLEDKAQKICKAAIDIFSTKNYTETTVSEIVRVAGVGKGTFYTYFKSKEDFFNFLIEHGINELIFYVQKQYKSGKTPEEKLKNAIIAQVEFFNGHTKFCSFFIREAWTYRGDFQQKLNYFKEEYITIFQDIIKEGVKEGYFKNVNSETISSALFGMTGIVSFHWILFYDQFPTYSIGLELAEVFLHGLVRLDNQNLE